MNSLFTVSMKLWTLLLSSSSSVNRARRGWSVCSCSTSSTSRSSVRRGLRSEPSLFSFARNVSRKYVIAASFGGSTSICAIHGLTYSDPSGRGLIATFTASVGSRSIRARVNCGFWSSRA